MRHMLVGKDRASELIWVISFLRRFHPGGRGDEGVFNSAISD